MRKLNLEQITDRARELFARSLARLATLLRPLAAPLRPAYDSVEARYRKLESRERLLVRIAAVLFGVLFLYEFVYTPLQSFNDDLDTQIANSRRGMFEAERLTRQYEVFQSQLAQTRNQTVSPSGSFSLFSVVEQALSRNPGRDKIGSMTPSDSKLTGGMTQYSVDLKLNALSLGEIVDTLYGLRNLPVPVTVSNLRITRRSQNSHTFDVDMTCVALGRAG